ncbi:MAG TPA: carbamoyl-phosphate synthase domain-containing protein, partial [Candidatus Hydrogenedentes bacterium]|nr:carbamoyl-phosphate synthase domain-containing protein [Candidatus Hydrogenedentota bacterium]
MPMGKTAPGLAWPGCGESCRNGDDAEVVFVKKAVLALENGTVFEGRAVGAQGESFGELVFNTSMTGYQEILTVQSRTGTGRS